MHKVIYISLWNVKDKKQEREIYNQHHPPSNKQNYHPPTCKKISMLRHLKRIFNLPTPRASRSQPPFFHHHSFHQKLHKLNTASLHTPHLCTRYRIITKFLVGLLLCILPFSLSVIYPSSLNLLKTFLTRPYPSHRNSHNLAQLKTVVKFAHTRFFLSK